jgi:predicted phage baseplate assembly protein
LRIATFNAVPATNATTAINELLGVADGTPGQTYQLANINVQPGTLQLAVQESPQSDVAPLVPWTVVDSLDPYGSSDRVAALDPEAGTITFGDGINGRIVPLVPQGGQIVALTYRWGGGEDGNVAVGAVTTLNSSGAGISGVVNFVDAAGGRDAETLDAAEIRARKDLSTRSRAVTTGDFEWITSQTPTVEVARALVVPLRLPLDASAPLMPVSGTACGPPVPTTAAGLADTVAAGVVSVVVVPQQDGPEPTPTPSFLKAVCQYLDPHRLVTTEVYVVPPQYARLCNMQVTVKGQPGYTRAQLQTLVTAHLSTYLHVLLGGDNGTGFNFGDELHIADLIAQIYRVAGIERVDSVTASFIRTKSNANPRQGSLVLCPSGPAQYDHLSLAPEENISFNADTFLLSTVS